MSQIIGAGVMSCISDKSRDFTRPQLPKLLKGKSLTGSSWTKPKVLTSTPSANTSSLKNITWDRSWQEPDPSILKCFTDLTNHSMEAPDGLQDSVATKYQTSSTEKKLKNLDHSPTRSKASQKTSSSSCGLVRRYW